MKRREQLLFVPGRSNNRGGGGGGGLDAALVGTATASLRLRWRRAPEGSRRGLRCRLTFTTRSSSRQGSRCLRTACLAISTRPVERMKCAWYRRQELGIDIVQLHRYRWSFLEDPDNFSG